MIAVSSKLVYCKPSRAWFTAATVPVKVIESLRLAPELIVTPVVLPSVSVPEVSCRLTWIVPVPALGSLIEIALLPVPLKIATPPTPALIVYGALMVGGATWGSTSNKSVLVVVADEPLAFVP